MGYNNGYDSGWSDCEAKLLPRIKELEAQHQARPQGGAAPRPPGFPADDVVELGSIAEPQTLQDGKLSTATVELNVVTTGGWDDRATTGANRPAPVRVTNEFDESYWEVPGWSWSTDGYFLNYYNGQAVNMTLVDVYYDEGASQVDGQIPFLGDVELSSNVSVTLVSKELEPDQESGDQICSIVLETPGGNRISFNEYVTEGDTSVLLHEETGTFDGDYYEVLEIDVPLDSQPGDSITGEIVRLGGIHLNYTPEQYSVSLPGTAKLVVPDAVGQVPRSFQALLTAVSSNPAASLALGGYLQAPAGTTLVYDSDVKPTVESGKATLLSFVETAPGVVTVSTLKTTPSAVVPPSGD